MMKKSIIAFAIISLIAAPKVLADEVSTQTQVQIGINGPTKNQEEFHENSEAKIHERETFRVSETSSPSSSPAASPEETPTPVASPTVSPAPNASASPTASPTISVTTNTSIFTDLSNLLKQLISLLQGGKN